MKICDETPIPLKIGIVTVLIIKIIIFHKKVHIKVKRDKKGWILNKFNK